ncbi:uncharacterized protein [Chelonus insularis]|uniref:uncharacterized protein n=1 Tax=Chelonus insularis TaxID=460826 RepID=UPI00158DEDA3|nr:uncharacterized protein LOC118071355 [Chelonus insularis]XP_034946357.1 uncharacterized protein LOC118071355 [Chelonus insularis]
MQLKLQLNLQQRAALRVSISFWGKKNLQDKVKIFFNNYGDLDDHNSKYEWKKFIKKALDEWNRDLLPLHLERDLIHIIKEIGEKIYNWYQYIEHENESQYGEKRAAIKYIDRIYWTPYGTADEVKILETFWLKNLHLNVAKVYNIACSDALEEHINDLWEKILPKIQKEFYNDIYKNYDRHILAYWKHRRDGDLSNLISHYEATASDFIRRELYDYGYDLNDSVDQNMLWLSVHQGYSLAVKYFWKKLTVEQRNNSVINCARTAVLNYGIYENSEEHVASYKKEKYIEIYIFLINQMTNDQRLLFYNRLLFDNEEDPLSFKDYCMGATVLRMFFFVWPWQELLIPVLNNVLQYSQHKSHTVYYLLEEITDKIIENHQLGYVTENSKYQSILHEVWCSIPKSVKLKIVDELPYENVISKLIALGDINSIKLIFNDPAIVDVRDEFIGSGKDGYIELIENNQYELLNQLIREIFNCEKDKKLFRQNMNIWEYFIVKDQYDQVDKLLDWQCSTPEERQYLKSGIDYLRLCQYFIDKEQYDLADKYLNWQFATKEESKRCIDFFLNDISSIERIYDFWKSCGININNAMEKSSNFLSWLLESDEKVAYFKKEKIVNSVRETLFTDFFLIQDLVSTMEAFLFWCLPSQEEIQQTKQVIGHKIGRAKCRKYISTGHAELAESFIKWALNEEKLIQSFIREFIMSDEGVAFCHDFIKTKNYTSYDMPTTTKVKRGEQYNAFIDFWIKPLHEIHQFRIKFMNCEIAYLNRMHKENCEKFIRFIEDLEVN